MDDDRANHAPERSSMHRTRGHYFAPVLAAVIGAPACGDASVATDPASSSGATVGPTAEVPTTLEPTPTSSTSAATGSSITADAQADMGWPEGFAPEPRWVLRDKDGERVQALVEPRCGHVGDVKASDGCVPLDFGSKQSFPCARVINHEGRYINLEFELASGKLEPCMFSPNLDPDPERTWQEVPGAGFVNPQCEGKPYTAAQEGIAYMDEYFTRPMDLFFVEGEPWYLSGTGCITTDFWYVGPGPSCLGPLKATTRCPIEPVPKWVHALLPKPPYTMRVEYK